MFGMFVLSGSTCGCIKRACLQNPLVTSSMGKEVSEISSLSLCHGCAFSSQSVSPYVTSRQVLCRTESIPLVHGKARHWASLQNVAEPATAPNGHSMICGERRRQNDMEDTLPLMECNVWPSVSFLSTSPEHVYRHRVSVAGALCTSLYVWKLRRNVFMSH